MATMVEVFHKQENTWRKETKAVMQWAKTKREQEKQVWQKEKAAVLFRANTQRKEDKKSLARWWGVTTNWGKHYRRSKQK